MDRPLDVGVQRRRWARRAAIAVMVIAGLAAFFSYGPDLIRPSVSRSRIRTAKVDFGPLDATISGSGTVVPEVEQVIASPIQARVVRILKRAGATLREGDPIVELDVTESVLAVERLSRSIALKSTEQARARLDLDRQLLVLEGRREVKELQLQSLSLQVARNRRLLDEGLISKEDLNQSEVAEAQARIELRQIEKEKVNAEQANRAHLEGLELEMTTLGRDRSEAQRQLDLATARAERDGVLTWTLTEEGAVIPKGAVVARLADLSSFRVDVTVSDVHAKRLSVGLPVYIHVGEETLTGRVSNVLPTIENGIITLAVALDEASSPLLRANLRVDVSIVAGRRERTLRVKKGPFVDGEGARRVFVVDGGRAVRMPVQIGIAGTDEFEIVSGLSEGDEVIISDMSDHMHLREVRIR